MYVDYPDHIEQIRVLNNKLVISSILKDIVYEILVVPPHLKGVTG